MRAAIGALEDHPVVGGGNDQTPMGGAYPDDVGLAPERPERKPGGGGLTLRGFTWRGLTLRGFTLRAIGQQPESQY